MAKTGDYKFDRGDRLRDKVTKFEGICVSRGDHISGCNTYGLQPTELKDGAPQETKWFDEPRMETVPGSVNMLADVDTRAVRTGADSVPRRTNQQPSSTR
jgi:hypothetical protein